MTEEEDFSSEQKFLLSDGAFGTVYRVKVESGYVVAKYMWTNQNENECEILKTLQHPNIVSYLGRKRNVERKIYAIIMEFCERGSLRHVLEDPKIVYSIGRAILWIATLFDVLQYLQSLALTHQDLKPNNIFVTNAFVLKVGDFGCARRCDATMSLPDSGGTYRYMSLEQFNGKASIRNDVHSVGLVSWEIIERRKVFSKYGLRSFDHQRFFCDLAEQRVLLEPCACPAWLQAIIHSSINFNNPIKQCPKKMTVIIGSIIESTIESMRVENECELPRIVQTQRSLIRPIGFDGTTNWVECQVDEEKQLDDKVTKEDWSFQHQREQEQDDFGLKKELLDKLPLKSTALREIFEQKYSRLSEEEKKGFLNRADEFLNDPQILPTIDGFEEKEIELNDLDRLSIESLDELFIKAYQADNQAVYQFYHRAIDIVLGFLTSSIGYFDLFGNMAQILEFPKIHQPSPLFTRDFHWRSFFSTKSKDFWVLLKVERGESLFVKRNFTYFAWLKGYWPAKFRNQQFVEHKEKKDFSREANRMILHSVERLGFDFIVAQLNKIYFTMYPYLGREIEASLRGGDWWKEDFKQIGSNYVFQLTNPPRAICSHRDKCPRLSGSSWGIPDYAQIPYFECTSQSEIDQIKSYGLIAEIFHFKQRYRSLKRSNLCLRGFVERIRRISETDQYERLSGKEFQFVKIRQENGKVTHLFLLDRPEEPEEPEEKTGKTWCFDEKLNVVAIECSMKRIDLNELHRFSVKQLFQIFLSNFADNEGIFESSKTPKKYIRRFKRNVRN